MSTSVKWSLRTEFKGRDSRELLACPVNALLGVSPSAAAELRTLGLRTIFDLATSPTFALAREILVAAQGQTTGVGLYGRVPGEFLDDSRRDLSFEALATESLESLRGLDAAAARALSDALGVANIGELAIWPPYRDAQSILSEAFGGNALSSGDSESPADLIPGSRRYPTERVQYDILVLDAVAPSSEQNREQPEELSFDSSVALTRSRGAWRGAGESASTERLVRIDTADSRGTTRLEAAGQLDLATLAQTAVGFEKPATGVILTYTQSWYMEGLSLGQLLHTVALAPGESTRIAMIDWSRRTSGITREGIGESEALVSDLERTRSISEIVSAVATEAQQGFSKSSGWSVGGQIGHAGGGAGSADLSQMSGGGGGSGSGGSGGVPVKLAAAHGESIGVGGGYGAAESTGWTTGQRNLSANMAQNVTDRTHQASTSSRNRWATIVREVSQSESERISTRAVTNFNHMHALSIEYFEIVQLYRVVVELSKAVQCLFVPMKVLNFARPGLVSRFRAAIAAAGLTPRVRALREMEPDRMALYAPARVTQWDPDPISDLMGERVGERNSVSLVLPLNFYIYSITTLADGAQPFQLAVVEFQDGRVVEVHDPGSSIPDIGAYKMYLVRYEPGTAAIPLFDFDVVRVRLKKLPLSAGYEGSVSITVELNSMRREGFPAPQGAANAELKFTIDVKASDTEPVVLEFTRTVTGRELYRHLSDNALYYSQAVWRSLDAATTGQMLAGYTFEDRPVLSSIDPVPVAVAGNYLVFRRHLSANDQAAKDKWDAWLAAQDITIGERQESTVPLPSGGVFAEAVLGRFNSAEKLDITRFWNWQDSPIPITAPDIAAIQAGSRAQPETLIPGQLSQPVLKVEIPPNIPDPEGLKAILQAIQNGNMFRDMSGLNSTIGFAQSALSRAFDSAKDAASQAGENMKTAVELYKAAFGGQGATTPGGSSQQAPTGTSRKPSETGALINQGKEMDRRGIPSTPETSPPATGGKGGSGTWEGTAMNTTLGGTPNPAKPGNGPKSAEKPPRVPATSDVISVTLKLRVFVPSPLWQSELTNHLIYQGDHRGFHPTDGTSRAAATVVLRIDKNSFKLTEQDIQPSFGWAKVYFDLQATSVNNRPPWWKTLSSPSAESILSPRQLNDNSFLVDVISEENLIHVDFALHGKPYFPWEIGDLQELDRNILAFLLGAYANPDIDADIRVTIAKGGPTYLVSGKHNQFPSFELYVNDELAHAYDSASLDDAPQRALLKNAVVLPVWRPLRLVRP